MEIPQILVAKALAVAYHNGTRSTTGPLSTTGKLRINNKASQDKTGASNLSGGFDRPNGVRELAGYMWAWGDLPPVFANDLFDLSFTLDGVTAVQVASGDATYSGIRCRGIEVVVLPYEKKKKNLVYTIAHLGGAGNDFSSAGTVPSDTTTPTFLNVKSLGVKFAYYDPTTTHALVWSPICYFAGMRLVVTAEADPVWPSCLNGIAYFPAGMIDARIELGQFINRWPLPTVSNPGAPYMLPGQPGSTPGVPNAVGDLAFPDLDSVVGIQMATRVNSDLTFNSYWQMLYGMLDEKNSEPDHDSPEPIQVQYVFERCSSSPSQTADVGHGGWNVGSISYVTGAPSSTVTTQFWP